MTDFISLVTGPAVTGEDLLHQIDQRILIILNGPPGPLQAGKPGQLAYDQVNKVMYRAKEVVTTPSPSTTWTTFPEKAVSADVSDGLNSEVFINATLAKQLLDIRQVGAVNYLRNGRMFHASRGTSFVVGAPKYTLNGWHVLRVGNQSGYNLSKVGTALRLTRLTNDPHTASVVTQVEQPLAEEFSKRTPELHQAITWTEWRSSNLPNKIHPQTSQDREDRTGKNDIVVPLFSRRLQCCKDILQSTPITIVQFL